jgi:hypothetical protein
MKHQRTKRVTRRKSVKTVGNSPRRRKIAKAVRGTRIAPKYVNRANTLANWVAGMTAMGTRVGDGRKHLPAGVMTRSEVEEFVAHG